MTAARVLMTADAVGGVWTFALELARGLTASGARVLLAVQGPAPDAAQRAEAAGIAGLELCVTGLGLEWQDRAGPLAAPRAGELLALEREFRPDLVHCNGFREAASGFTAPAIVVAHSCVATWWHACHGTPMPAGWGRYARGVRAGLAAAAAVTAPTAAFLRDFEAAWGALPEARVIANGLDLRTAPAVQRQAVVLAAGRLWDAAKNVAALAAAAPGLPWPVEVAGAGAEDGQAGPVRHLGRLRRDALQRRMASAAIFAAPVRYEPFGLAVLEAAATGCALVLGRQASLVELWDGAACFVPAEEPAALHRALRQLIADPHARQRLGHAARRRAVRFDRRRMVEGYQRLYADVLRGAGMRAA